MKIVCIDSFRNFLQLKCVLAPDIHQLKSIKSCIGFLYIVVILTSAIFANRNLTVEQLIIINKIRSAVFMLKLFRNSMTALVIIL